MDPIVEIEMRLGVVALLPLCCSGLVVVPPTVPVLQHQAFLPSRQVLTDSAGSLSSAIFPSNDSGPALPASALLAKNCNEEACTDEEVAQAKAEAQRTFLIIVLASALPSLYAQDELVWKRERQEQGAKQTKAAKKRR